MEKEHQPDSMATVNIKPEYPPSEPSVYGSEPPPAYPRSQSSSVQVAKIIAVTVVLVSVVLGSFLLASAYVTANASCRQLEQELELLSEAADRFQATAPLQPEALVQDEPQKKDAEPLESEASQKHTNEIDNNNVDNNAENSDSEEEDRTPIHFKLPLQLDFDDLAGALIDKNQRSRMNCVVEKKRAEQVVDHQPKTLRLPFGLNLTTDPKYEHISGERMAIFCESGNVRSNSQPENNNNINNNSDEDDDDDDEETIMIQPVMIPIPQSHFPTHMAQQMPQRPPQQLFQHLHPMETMRPPMPPMPQQQQQQQPQNQLPPTSILQHIAQQIITQKIMEAQRAREEQQNQEPSNNQQEQVRRFPIPEGMMGQRIPIPEEVITQLNRLPNRDVIVAVQQEQEPEEISQEMQSAPQEIRVPQMRLIPQEMRAQPQIVHVEPQEMRAVPQEMHVVRQEMRVVQEPRQNAQEMNGRQTYARGLPVNIPVHMIQQEPEAAPSEETRPHYVQPRSVRSVDALLPKSQKRVKRCSCDCAC